MPKIFSVDIKDGFNPDDEQEQDGAHTTLAHSKKQHNVPIKNGI